MWWRVIMVVASVVIAGASLLQLRGETSYRPMIAGEAMRPASISQSRLTPGGSPAPPSNTPYELSAFDVNEGKRLYRWFNCHGCHANGGGGIGPALMDDKWIYGAEPRNIYETILEGRPNGMPSFRNKIPDAQTWQIVGYVRSMSGLVPFYARPSRSDDLRGTEPETMAPVQPPKQAAEPSDGSPQ
jgi:cytochrome c oxidase cbb3-type subunit III